jgi:hypothetical protein
LHSIFTPLVLPEKAGLDATADLERAHKMELQEWRDGKPLDAANVAARDQGGRAGKDYRWSNSSLRMAPCSGVP